MSGIGSAGTYRLGDRDVTRMGYGAMQLAGPGVFVPPRDRAEAVAVLREAVAHGGTHIDTSDFYGPHVTNRLIREALHPYPENLVIVTKVGAVRGADKSWNPAFSAADLTAAAVYKTGGAIVHKREGSPNMQLAKWLMIGSIPMALLGPHLVAWVVDPDEIDDTLKLCIGFALLLAAATYALRLYVNLRRELKHGPQGDPDPKIRPILTFLIGALGGLLVGITSVGSGSVIMIALLMLYPGLSAVKLVGTDLVQAVPLVLAAAISNIVLHGLDWNILIPLVIGSVPGTLIGSHIAPKVPQSFIRRGIVVVLTMSGVALLDKAGWAPLGAGEDETHPILIAVVGLIVLLLLPLVWGLIRRSTGLPMFGAPTIAQLEDPHFRPGIVGMKRVDPSGGASEASDDR